MPIACIPALRTLVVRSVASLMLLPSLSLAAHTHPAHAARHTAHVHESARASRHMAVLQHRRRSHSAATSAATRIVTHRDRHGRLVRTTVAIHHRSFERFSSPSFTDNIDSLTAGDVTAGEDPLIRASLVEALGNYNGTALAIDPKNGRILSMVNQKMALGPGNEPCFHHQTHGRSSSSF